MRQSCRKLEVIWVTAFGFIFLLLWVAPDLSPTNLYTSLLGDLNDALSFVWIFDEISSNAFRIDRGLFDGNILYPAKNTLLFSESMFLSGFLYQILKQILSSELAAFNLLLLCFLCANFTSMYLLCKNLFGRAASLGASLVFAFSLVRLAQIDRVHLMPQFPFPLVALSLWKFEQGGRSRHLVIACLWSVVQFYLSTSLGIILLFTLFPYGGLCVWRVIRRRQKWGPLLATSALGVFLVAPYAGAYFKVNRVQGFQRTMSDARAFSTNVINLWMVPEGHPYGPVLSMSRFLREPPPGFLNHRHEKYLFLGFAALLLIFLHYLGSRHKNQEAERSLYRFLFFSALFVFWLSMGPKGGLYWLLYHLVPPLRAIRTPVRFSFSLLFFASIFVGAGISQLQQVTSKRVAAAALSGLLVLFIWENHWPTPLRGIPQELSGATRFLAERKDRAPVLHFPFKYEDSVRMYYGLTHGHPLVNGNCGFVPPSYVQFQELANRLPETPSIVIEVLKSRGVKYLVVEKNVPPSPIRPVWLNWKEDLGGLPLFEDADAAVITLSGP